MTSRDEIRNAGIPDSWDCDDCGMGTARFHDRSLNNPGLFYRELRKSVLLLESIMLQREQALIKWAVASRATTTTRSCGPRSLAA
jgi:hypothetical protein